MKLFNILILAAVLLCLLGCGESASTIPGGPTSANFDPKWIAAEAPTDPLNVGEAREKVKDKQPIRMVGRIGGSPNPFVDGVAAFTLMDLSLPDCAGGDCSDDGCCTPEELKRNLATVKFVNDYGKAVAVDARELLNVDAKSKVAVEGTAQRDEAGNLVVLAGRLYVYPAE
jgi:hypothetical protein